MRRLPRILRIVAAAVSLVISLSLFCGSGVALSNWAAFQLGPALARLAAAFTFGALGIAVLILALTFLFGRFYCVLLCPLGILQDLIGALSFRKSRPVKNFPLVRYWVLLAALLALALGWAIGWRLLDPFSEFGAIAGGVGARIHTALYNHWNPETTLPVRPGFGWSLAAGLVPLAILTALVVWKKRIYCTAVCPVGTLLGLAAKSGWFRLTLDKEQCVKCGKCVRSCPSGCIALAKGEIDNERCVRCMNCFSACPVGAIHYGHPAAAPAPVDVDRRRLLIGGAATAAVTVGAVCGFKPTAKQAAADQGAVYPPGAGSAARFRAKCTGCQLCVVNCRGNVLRPAGDGADTVHLKFDRGMCEFNCDNCGRVCPTGAIVPMALPDKRRCRIGLAEYIPPLCVAVADGTDCGACAEHCPTGALRMEPDSRGIRIPKLTSELCIGCGSCEYACPVRPERAIVVRPVPIQVRSTDPEEYFRTHAKPAEPAPAGDNGWLI